MRAVRKYDHIGASKAAWMAVQDVSGANGELVAARSLKWIL